MRFKLGGAAYDEFDSASMRQKNPDRTIVSRTWRPALSSKNRAFYYRRRVVVVGAGGFIGSHLCRRLVDLRADVVGLVRCKTAVDHLPRAMTIARADATSREQLGPLVQGGDIIFQLSGRSGAAASMAEPAADMLANCGSMLALLEVAATRDPRPRVIFTGSRLQYGRVSTLPVDETHPKLPTSPYGLHKTLCEEYLEYYHRQFGVTYSVARLTNPYGNAFTNMTQSYNVFDQLIARASAGRTLTVYGDGRQIRDYIHIDDVVDALLLLGRLPDTTIVNIGSGNGIAFVDAVREIAVRTGESIVFTAWPQQALAVETGDFVANIDKAKRLGFVPKIPLAQGICRAILRHDASAGERIAVKK